MRVHERRVRFRTSFLRGGVREFFLHVPIQGYGFFCSVREQIIRLLLGVGNCKVFVVPASYNLGFDVLLNTLKEEGFVKQFLRPWTYTDYPKLLSASIEFSTKVGETQWAYSMVDPSKGLSECMSKVFGEAFERHAALLPDQSSRWYPRVYRACPRFSYHDMPQYSDVQKKKFPHFLQGKDGLHKMDCVTAWNTARRQYMPIPLQCAYYGYRVSEHKLHEGTTNGCGGGFTYEQAALSAIYELIERDHLLLWWFSGLAPKRLDFSAIDTPFFNRVRQQSERYTLDVFFLDTRYDVGVVSCVCVVIDPVLNCMAMGAKAGSGEDIFEGAYCEAIQVLAASRARVAEKGFSDRSFFEENHFLNPELGQYERETAVCTPEAIQHVRKQFLSGPSVGYAEVQHAYRTFATKKEELRYLEGEFTRLSRKHGSAYNLYLYTFASRWLRDYSYKAVRAYVPSFLKLHLRESEATPHSKRLRQFYMAQGISDAQDFPRNTHPHFFP